MNWKTNPKTSTLRLDAELGFQQSCAVHSARNPGKLHKLPNCPTSIGTNPGSVTNAHLSTVASKPYWLFFKTFSDIDKNWWNTRIHKWLNPGKNPNPVSKRGRFEHKACLVKLTLHGLMVHYEFVQEGRWVIADHHTVQLDRMYTTLSKYPGLVNREPVLVQKYYASLRVTRSTKQKLADLRSVEFLHIQHIGQTLLRIITNCFPQWPTFCRWYTSKPRINGSRIYWVFISKKYFLS